MNYPTEDRNYKHFKPPVPVINMSVDIQPEWEEEFWKLSKLLKLSNKETINWLVNNWFQEHLSKTVDVEQST